MADAQRMLRAELVHRLFPQGVPKLWCPPISHYRSDGAIDRTRTAAHWNRFVGHVGGLLVPGSTGDGWEMDQRHHDDVVDVALGLAPRMGMKVLIGALKPTAEKTAALMQEVVAQLQERTERSDVIDALAEAGVCGFAVCPPTGSQRSVDQIEQDLTRILELGLPTALYQLPQVTGNEISPQTAARLAARFGNFLLLKDSSGQDRIAQSGEVPDDVFLVRGAEGDYVRQLRPPGGPYDGLLLSSANVFACELATMIRLLSTGHADEAAAVSQSVGKVIAEAFQAVEGLPRGNPFSLANRAMDHVMAYGCRSLEVDPPRLYGGGMLPRAVIAHVAESMDRSGLGPTQGYLEA